jgi:hypothetical protein
MSTRHRSKSRRVAVASTDWFGFFIIGTEYNGAAIGTH